MFKLITRYNSVKEFLLKEKSLFLSTATCFLLKEDNQETVISDRPVYTFRYFNEKIFFQHDNGSTLHMYDLETGNTTSFEGIFYLWLAYIEADKLFITAKVNGKRAICFIRDTVLYETALDETPSIVHQNIAIVSLGKLEAKDVNTGRQLWIKNFEDPLEIEGDVYKAGDNIIVPFNDNRLVGLDMLTGEQLWELTNCFSHYAQHPVTGWLYGYGGTAYEVVDPVNGIKIIDKDFTAAYKELKVLPTSNPHYIDGDRMYFMSNFSDVRFGAIDLVNHSVAFVQLLEVDPGVTGYIPQHHDGKLYVRDTESVLHAFEVIVK